MTFFKRYPSSWAPERRAAFWGGIALGGFFGTAHGLWLSTPLFSNGSCNNLQDYLAYFGCGSYLPNYWPLVFWAPVGALTAAALMAIWNLMAARR
jgi:hypothetical protein